jgi:hypothetical protein
MKNRNFPWAIIAAAAVAGAGFGGVANYVRHESPMPSNGGKIDGDQSGVTVGKDALSGDHKPTNSSETNSNNPDEGNNSSRALRTSKVDALNKAIRAKTYDQKGIRVLDVTVENGNAIVDMNDPVRYNWGSEEEADFIKLMADTLAEFPSVKTFQIRVDGEILKTLSHFEVDPVKVR